MPASAASRSPHNRVTETPPRGGREATEGLLAHYDAHARPLPWRALPGEPAPDAYRVWLSEVMLQQTTVATVRPRYRRFLQRWATIEELAAAPDKEVLSEWAGLGYYARARNLIACARQVTAMGGFPRSEAELRRLPGLGVYTAAAIAAIAFGERAAVVDTNVERVVARLHALERPVAELRPRIRALVDAMTPVDRPGDFAQAMMDLGATICRPRNPDCPSCPLLANCAAAATGMPERFPTPKQRKARPYRHGIAWWTERGGAVWLVRRPAKGMLGGMAALPGPEWSEQAPPAAAVTSVSHAFTHFTLDLHIVEARDPVGEGWWQPLDRLDEAGLPTLYARAIHATVMARSLSNVA